MKFPPTLSVAPMLDLTDRHCRAFLRRFSAHAMLYTEMIVAAAIVHGRRAPLLDFDALEHPVAIQLGGCDPNQLAACAGIAEQWGYDEVNLNVGCPSGRVQNARFGACLMAEPERVADCMRAMRDRVGVPLSVKTRLGIDDLDSYGFLSDFVGTVAAAGCGKFLLHARKAWLHGLSPKDNRTIPPLDYDRVYRLKRDFPHLEIIINGGISDADAVETHLAHVDGVMIGRAAYHNPWLLRVIDERLFAGGHDRAGRFALIHDHLPYMQARFNQGVYLWRMARHMLGAFHGQGGAREWRRYLSVHGAPREAGLNVIVEALQRVQPDAPTIAGGDMMPVQAPG